MKAICISEHPQMREENEVFKYEECYVSKTKSKSLPYRVYEKTDLKYEDIEFGYHHVYYYINGIIYSTYLTNDYKAIIKKSSGFTQISMFDIKESDDIEDD